MRSKVLGTAIHVVICLCFLLIPYSFDAGGTRFPVFDASSAHDRNVLLSYLLILSFLYLNYYFLIPKFYFTKRYALYWAVVAVICLTIVNIPELLRTGKGEPGGPPNGRQKHERKGFERNGLPDHPGPGPGGVPPYTHGIFISAIGIFLTLYIRTNNQWKFNERKKLSAELSSLKFQINPHFLFNTLNSIYALSIREKSRMTADSILKLSAIMRYVVTEVGKDLVPLANEVNYINDYVALQKIRLGPSVKLDYAVNGEPRDLKISPLILITFIENAFKYGVNPDESSEIFIQIDIAGVDLILKVRNRKVRIGSTEPLSSGIGIENTQARLDFYYKGRYNLSINDGEEYYEVLLSVSLGDLN